MSTKSDNCWNFDCETSPKSPVKCDFIGLSDSCEKGNNIRKSNNLYFFNNLLKIFDKNK